MPGWDGFPISEAFAGEYEAPVFVDNDVNVMALGEHRDGVGKGEDDVLFVKIGTGIGGGIIADGHLQRGSQGCAGDIGHICVDPDGPVCSCGNKGCLEAMAAAPAIAAKAEGARRRVSLRSSAKSSKSAARLQRGTSARQRLSEITTRSR